MSGPGTLYGVGVGPGDPDLMTLKADRLIRSAGVIAYPAPAGGDSFARAIAAKAISGKAEEVRIEIPMDERRFPAQAVYDEVAETIANRLDSGKDVVTLCEGDPFFYGSFMYLFARLCDRFPTEIIPGVSSVTTCAAMLKRPLSARNEVLSIVPGTLPEDELRARLEAAESVAIMKIGRHLPKIRRVLDGLDLTKGAGYIERASLPNQRILALCDAPERAPYFSMILITKGGDPWLS